MIFESDQTLILIILKYGFLLLIYLFSFLTSATSHMCIKPGILISHILVSKLYIFQFYNVFFVVSCSFFLYVLLFAILAHYDLDRNIIFVDFIFFSSFSIYRDNYLLKSDYIILTFFDRCVYCNSDSFIY